MKDGGGLSEIASFVESIRGKLISFEASQLPVNRSERTINIADSNYKHHEGKYFLQWYFEKLAQQAKSVAVIKGRSDIARSPPFEFREVVRL